MADDDTNEGTGQEQEQDDWAAQFDKEYEAALQEAARMSLGSQDSSGSSDDDEQDEEDDSDVRSELAATQKRLATLEHEQSEARKVIKLREESRQVDRLATTFLEKATEYEKDFASMIDLDHGLEAFKSSVDHVKLVAERARKRAEADAEKARRETYAEMAKSGVQPITTPRLEHSKDEKANAALEQYNETGDEDKLREYIDRVADGFMGHQSQYA